MSNENRTAASIAIATGALTGIGNATATYAGAAASTSALASLGGGAIAAGGGGMVGGITALASAAAWPAAAVAVAGFGGYKLYKWLAD